MEERDISTHTPLAGRDSEKCNDCDYDEISTHTPLAGRDGGSAPTAAQAFDFYSHAPCGT